MTRGGIPGALIRYLGGLTATQGDGAGDPFRVLHWQRRFIRGAFAQGVETAALSIGRGNGKTALVAAIAAATVNGPISQPRAESLLVASSFSQARIAFDHVLAFLQPAIQAAPWDFQVQDNAQRASIRYRPTGATLKVLGSDPKRAHGLAPVLVLADEPAQWPPSTSGRMLAALVTSLGKIEGGRLIALGTAPDDTAHWFSRWAHGGADYAQLHAAPADAPPYRRRTWKLANPSIDYFPTLEETIRRAAQRARADDAELTAFRALRLNSGTPDTGRSLLLAPDAWKACETPDLPDPDGPYVLGVDLGSGAAMSAVAAYWPQTGRLECWAAFPSNPDLAARGNKDGVGGLYERMYGRGELTLTGGRTVDVGELIGEAVNRWGVPSTVVADRWRQQELMDSLELAGVRAGTYMPRGMGFKDGADDVRRFRRAALEGKIRTPQSLLMRSAIGGAVTVSDTAGNAKLAKAKDSPERRDGHRDDAAAAAILAVAEGIRNPPRQRRGYLGVA